MSDDDWAFLNERRGRRLDAPAPTDTAETADTVGTAKKVSAASGRAHGEFRAEMRAVPLRQRARPIALALMAVSIAGFLTEVVATSQMLTLVGPKALLVIYPLGGIGLLTVAILQARHVDHAARLPMLRAVSMAYAMAYAAALALLAGSVAPIFAIGAIWLLADQLNFLMPLLLWSLAGDEFNVAEGRKVFGWIITWTYLGQIIGLVVATASPLLLEPLNLPLPVLLVVNPLVCVGVGLLLPGAMRNSAAAKGSERSQTMSQAVRTPVSFVWSIPAWRALFIGSLLTFAAGMTAYLGYSAVAESLIPGDAGQLQIYLGLVMLIAFGICWLVQKVVAEKLQERLGIPGVLLVLPIATVLAALVLLGGSLLGSLPMVGVGIALWLIPRWSVDENARRGALALVPDERRARVSYLVDLTPMVVGLVAAGPLALIGVVTGREWITFTVAAVLALAAIPFALKTRRTWEDSMLNWRLRRRKRNRTLDLGEETGNGLAKPTEGLFHVGMRWKLLLAFAGAFTLVYVVIAVWVLNTTANNAYERIRSQLTQIATGGVETINAQQFEDMVAKVKPVQNPSNPTGLGYPDDPLYASVALDLFRINQIDKQAMPYSYYRDPEDGQLYFAASGGYYFEPRFGVPYGVPVAAIVGPETYALMEQGLQGLVEQGAYEDEYGKWISSYSPITTKSGEVVGAVGLDYSLAYVDQIREQVRRQLLVVLSVTYLLLLGLVMWISSAIVRPVRRLTEATGRIAAGEYDVDLSAIVKTQFPDEMAELAHSFAVMADKVAARERSLTREVTRLRVEIDEAKRDAAVKEITDSDFFSDLTAKAAEMRRRMREE